VLWPGTFKAVSYQNFLPILKHLTVTLLILGIVTAGDIGVTDNKHTEFEDVFDNIDNGDNYSFL